VALGAHCVMLPNRALASACGLVVPGLRTLTRGRKMRTPLPERVGVFFCLICVRSFLN